MPQFKHPHTPDQLYTAAGAAADFLRGRGFIEVDVVPVDDLKGKALDAALKDAGLPLTGNVAAKKAALAAHLAAEGAPLAPGGQSPDGAIDDDPDVVVATDPTQVQ